MRIPGSEESTGMDPTLTSASVALLYWAYPGRPACPIGVVLVDEAEDRLYCKTRVPDDPDASEIVGLLADELIVLAEAQGGKAILDYIQQTFSNTIHAGDSEVVWVHNPAEALENLFSERVSVHESVIPRPAHKVLVVEDSPADAFLIKQALQDYCTDTDVTVATDGERALDILEASDREDARPDLVLLDLNLPKLSGHEVLEVMRSNPRLRKLPVAVLSSSGARADMDLAYKEGANAYVQKADTLAAFTASVSDLCARFFTAAA